MSQEKLKTVDIKGKSYVLVSERVKAFRENYPDFGMITKIIELSDKRVVMCATINDPNGNPVATGYAYEDAGSSFINKTSYIENCETSAWGRALANFGIGIDGSMCSAEELSNALLNQNKQNKSTKDITYQLENMIDDNSIPVAKIDKVKINTLREILKERNSTLGKKGTEKDFAGLFHCNDFAELNIVQFKQCVDILEKDIKKADTK